MVNSLRSLGCHQSKVGRSGQGCRSMHGLVALVLLLFLSGCASTGGVESPDPVDPWEGFNRKVFSFNDVIDQYALKPVAKGYQKAVPDPVQSGVGNFFSNLGELRTVLNSVLQGKPANAGSAAGRFLINSTFGLGGILDMATPLQITAKQEDFGQTLAVWGWEDSRYLVLPLLGPSTLRDTSGLPLDSRTGGLEYFDDAWMVPLTGLYLVDMRAGLLDQESMIQGDRYRFIRDAYLQRRRFMIDDGVMGDDPFAADDFDFDDADFEEASP